MDVKRRSQGLFFEHRTPRSVLLSCGRRVIFDWQRHSKPTNRYSFIDRRGKNYSHQYKTSANILISFAFGRLLSFKNISWTKMILLRIHLMTWLLLIVTPAVENALWCCSSSGIWHKRRASGMNFWHIGQITCHWVWISIFYYWQNVQEQKNARSDIAAAWHHDQGQFQYPIP